MIKETYKPGEDILSSSNKNKYCQWYWFNAQLWYKGYIKNNKHIGYQEYYLDFMNKGIRYVL